MAKNKTKYDDVCYCCKGDLNGPFATWQGPPFIQRGSCDICFYCLSAIKPKVAKKEQNDPGIAITGTYINDIYRLSEMKEDGFDERRAKVSLKKVGELLGLSKKDIQTKLK